MGKAVWSGLLLAAALVIAVQAQPLVSVEGRSTARHRSSGLLNENYLTSTGRRCPVPASPNARRRLASTAVSKKETTASIKAFAAIATRIGNAEGAGCGGVGVPNLPHASKGVAPELSFASWRQSIGRATHL